MTRVTGCLALACLLVLSSRAAAELIEFRFTGSVVSTKDPDLLPLGQSMSGSYTFESDVVDVGNAEVGDFRDASNTEWSIVVHLRVESGDVVLETPANRLEIVNAGGSLIIYRNPGVVASHTYGVYFQRDLEGRTWSPPLHGEDVWRAFFELIDENQQAIVDPSILPLDPPDLDDFTIRRLRLYVPTDGNLQSAEFSIDSLTRVPVRLLPGTKLLVSDPAAKPAKRKIELVAKTPLVETPAPGSDDPTQIGGALRIANPKSGGDDALLALPAAGWQGLGRPAGSKGWQYKDPRRALGACTSVVAKPGKSVTATCKGAAIPFTLDEPSQGSIAVSLTLGDDQPQCMHFGGTVRKDRPGIFKARNAPALSCPLPP